MLMVAKAYSREALFRHTERWIAIYITPSHLSQYNLCDHHYCLEAGFYRGTNIQHIHSSNKTTIISH